MKKIRFLALLLLVALLAAGCGKGSSGDGQETSSAQSSELDSTGGSEQAQPPAEEASFITLFGKDSSQDYKIISGKHNADSAVNEFANKVMQKIGRSLKVNDGSTAETDKEILIGYVANREESVSAYNEISSVEYDVRFIDGKLTVSAYSSKGLKLALDYVAAYLVKGEGGEYGLLSDFEYTAKSVRIDYDVPKLQTKRGYVLDATDSNSLYSLAYKNVTSEEVSAYGELLKGEGYTVHSTNTIGMNAFASYLSDELQVHTMYYPSLKEFRVVFGVKGYQPSVSAPEYTRTNDVVLTQNPLTGTDQGMSYIVRLADGSFLMIDGGRNNSQHLTNLWNYVNENKPATDSKPRIIWMFTHAHVDHIQLALEFLQSYSSKIDLKMVCYNFPNADDVVDNAAGLAPHIKNLKSILKSKYPNTETYVYHSGQKLLLPGVEIEFLATQEDYWPLEFTNENLTSNVWRMKFEDGRTCLIVGDLENDGSARLATVYGSELQSDIFQVNHHGKSGMTKELINYVDPKICLWACTKSELEDDNVITGSAVNKDLKASLKTSKWTRNGTTGDRVHYHGEYSYLAITFKPSV